MEIKLLNAKRKIEDYPIFVLYEEYFMFICKPSIGCNKIKGINELGYEYEWDNEEQLLNDCKITILPPGTKLEITI